jgi:TonB family protein
MNKSRLFFFLAVLAVVVGIARCNSRTTSQTASPKPVETASPKSTSSLLVPAPNPSPAVTAAPSAAAQSQTPADLKKLAERVSPSVIALLVFDASGKPLRNGTGFFVSDDGRLVTSRAIVDGAAYAVAKASDGKIHNVIGILAEAAPADLAILKAQVKERVPFVSPSKMAPFEAGGTVAVVGSPVNRKENTNAQATIAGRKSDTNSEWLELTTALPADSLGAPVINERGDVLGLVTLQRGNGTAVNVVRMASALDPVFARIDVHSKPAWAVQASPEQSPSPPAEGPLQKPKVPLAGQVPPGQTRLIFSPTPPYPFAARRGFQSVKGAGRYRVHFGRDGSVRDVQILQSTRDQTLDGAAIETLRKWRSAPGQEWTANVPITFQP